MLSIKKLNQSEFERKQKTKIDRELPYFITLVTLLTNAGFGPYLVLQKLRDIDLLPTISQESQKMLKRIDLLGLDPLKVLSQAKEKSSSKALGEFLDGYVATVQSGGSLINYLKSKMTSVFERYAEVQKQAVEKLGALVEAYMTLQVVLLAIYVISVAVVSNAISQPTTNSNADVLLMILAPIISVLFLVIIHKASILTTPELEISKILRLAIPIISITGIIVGIGIISDPGINAYIIGFGLIAASIWPALAFRKHYVKTIAAEKATPKILRNITEARKTGMSPETCVIYACKRHDYEHFNKTANGLARRLQWGVGFQSIFENLQKEVKNFNTLISFKILFELISSGGGNNQTLDSLTEMSEKMYELNKTAIDMLKPYLLVGFILMGTTAFTTLIVTDSFGNIAEHQIINNSDNITVKTTSSLGFYPIIVLVQSWMAGLFLGKMMTGAFSGGFQYSILLVIISLICISLIQYSIIDINSIFL